MTQQINYQTHIPESIPIIFEWMIKQDQLIKETEDFKELDKVLKEIDNDKDYSKDSFLDIQFLLRPFEEQLPLKIKRLFNISLLDNYTIFIASRHFETIDDFINLELSTRRFKGNTSKFFYNPIPLTNVTRNLFTHLQTLFIYNRHDNLFENDRRIVSRKIQICPYHLKGKEKHQLEEWTELECGEILFDSDYNLTDNKTNFVESIKRKKELVFLVQDLTGEKFGFYLHSQIEEKENVWIPTDPKSFYFNFEYKDNELQTKQSKVKDTQNGYFLFDNLNERLITLGKMKLMKFEKTNEKVKCAHNCYWKGKHFTMTKLVVIQMKKTEKQKEFDEEKERKQMKQIEEWTGLQYSHVIFDSGIDNWSIRTSTFDDIIKGRKHLVFLIEDERNETFGYYLNTMIKNEYNDECFTSTDSKSFEFNVESNGRMDKMMKFPIKDTSCGYCLYDKSEEMLISLGNITLWKENKKGLSDCLRNEENFDYQGIENAVCGRSTYEEDGIWKGKDFTPMRIRVIQMKMTEKQKFMEQHKEDQQMTQIEEWTGLRWTEILFDSEKDNWLVNESKFDEKIKGKKQLVFWIENSNAEIFGYYLSTEIGNEDNSQIKSSIDTKSFLFNLESNGRLKGMMKFEITNISNTNGCVILFDKKDFRLIQLGDIVLFKENDPGLSFCTQNNDTYDYHGIEKALCGRMRLKEKDEWKGEYFIPTRIKVIQME